MFHAKHLRLAAIATLMVISGPLSSNALAKGNTTAMVNEPMCHALIKGRFVNLDQLCGVQEVLPTIDLKIDRDRDGISDHLLTAIQTQQKAFANARSTREVEAAERTFQQRLPYSSQVRQLQAQQRNLRDLGRREQDFMKTMEIMEQANNLQTQIENDPNYKAIQAAIDKAHQKMGIGTRSAKIFNF
jgi:Skp family chaperone for outer membrane proteins